MKAGEDRRRKRVVAFRIPVALIESLDSKASRVGSDRTEVLLACLWSAVDAGLLPRVKPGDDPRESVLGL